MNKQIEAFLKFYKDNEDKLIYEDGIRPAKSLTRNIFNNVDKFEEWYKKTKKVVIYFGEIVNDICRLTETGITTIEDNIRGMEELKFLIEVEPQIYKLTRNFIDYIYSNKTLEQYILDRMRKISSISDITMFENYILATLREGIIKGYIVHYPDGYPEFERKVPDKEERSRICLEVYSLYGFRGRNKNPEDGNYTPNINYRIVSTCKQLGLIEIDNTDQYDNHGFAKYKVTILGKNLLSKIGENIENSYPIKIEENQNNTNYIEENVTTYSAPNTTSLIDDMYDELYVAESNNIAPETILNILDLPEPLANKYAKSVEKKRDPQKAANAKAQANYLCEFGKNHQTFKAKSNNENYVEAHHLVPIQLQPRFFYSLDIEANIVALCPICHRRIHHATNEEKREIITKLYNDRIERLKKCNIYIELEDLINFYSEQ